MTGCAPNMPRGRDAAVEPHAIRDRHQNAMAGPRTGSVVRRPTRRGVSYGVRFTYHGRRIYHHIGGSWEGCTEEQAAEEAAYVIAQVKHGEYVPAGRSPAPRASGDDRAVSFRTLASIWLARQRPRIHSSKSYADLEWRLNVAVDHLGERRVGDIHAHDVDDMVTALLTERAEIEEAERRGEPAMETYRDSRTGKEYLRRQRGLSHGSINKVVAAVRRVLEDAERRGLIGRQPVDARAKVKPQRPRRSFLEVSQGIALLDAARAIEAEQQGLTWGQVREIRASRESHLALARRYRVSDTLIRKIRRGELWAANAESRRNDVPRLAILATLMLAGLRIAELCGLDGVHLEFPRRRIRVPRSATKTDAGERYVPMVPALHELLLEHHAQHNYGPEDPVFATRTGRRNTANNVRKTILAPAHARANALLAANPGLPPIEHLTPQTLRRTFASLLAELSVPPRRAMALVGHTNPSLTMGVYQAVLDTDQAAVDQLARLLGAPPDEALVILCGRSLEASAGPTTAHLAAPGPVPSFTSP